MSSTTITFKVMPLIAVTWKNAHSSTAMQSIMTTPNMLHTNTPQQKPRLQPSQNRSAMVMTTPTATMSIYTTTKKMRKLIMLPYLKLMLTHMLMVLAKEATITVTIIIMDLIATMRRNSNIRSQKTQELTITITAMQRKATSTTKRLRRTPTKTINMIMDRVHVEAMLTATTKKTTITTTISTKLHLMEST